jgi:hypothetical protein
MSDEDDNRRKLALTAIRRAWYAFDKEGTTDREATEILAEAATLLKQAELKLHENKLDVDQKGPLLIITAGERPRRQVVIEREGAQLRVYRTSRVVAVWDEREATFKPVGDGYKYAVEAVLEVALEELAKR